MPREVTPDRWLSPLRHPLPASGVQRRDDGHAKVALCVDDRVVRRGPEIGERMVEAASSRAGYFLDGSNVVIASECEAIQGS